MNELKKIAVKIYTDGACKKNPGAGGYAALLTTKQDNKTHEKIIKGQEALTTNNRMELMAVIKALESLKRPCSIDLYSDSQYVVKGITEWIINWEKNNWKNAARKPVENKDLWQRLKEATIKHSIKWHWVKAHAGHKENEIVDAIASGEAEKAAAKIL
ncbi:MAG: ribonuclease HI [bacterium]|nr:ribonuclease HI [bacterium]